jgi:hypothetical protein
MSEEILIPRDFDKGLKKGDLKLSSISQNVNDNITNELYDELVKKVNEQFAEELNKEHDLPIDSILIDYLLECRKIYRENDIFNKNMSLGSFLQLQLVRIVNKCD